MRLYTDLPFTCVTCEMEIAGTPVFHVGLPFCCAGCVADGPCICSYDEAPERREPAAHRRTALRQPLQAPLPVPAATPVTGDVSAPALVPDLEPTPVVSDRRTAIRAAKERPAVAAR